MKKLFSLLLVLLLLGVGAEAAMRLNPITGEMEYYEPATLEDNTVVPAKLKAYSGTPDNTTVYFGDGVWRVPSLSVQALIDAKQNLDADLTVLSYPDNWRIFVSNGSHAITEIALGDNNTFFKSNGPATLPGFAAGTVSDNAAEYPILNQNTTGNAATATALAANGANCSAGQAPLGVDNVGAAEGCWTPTANLNNTTMDNTIITKGTIDNAAIGSVTPSTGVFTTLAKAGVSNAQFGYLSTTTSDIQVQLGTKRGLDNVTFTGAGVASFDNEVQATLFSSTGLDNTHYINVANTGAPNSGTETTGDCYYDNTTTAWLCWDGNSWEPPAFSTLFHGTNPTIDGEGEAGVDTTADQLVYYGTAERVLTYQYTKDFVIKGYTAADDNVVKWKADTNQTLTQLDCITGGTDNVTVTLYECDANAANCSTTGLVAAATSTNVSDSSASNGSIDANDWIKVSLSTLQGTATSVACTVRYAITRQ